MIRELICYKCECAKCGHSWTTKAHELPLNCAKCKSTKWNDDYDFSLPQNAVVEPLPIVSQAPGVKMRLDQLKALIAPIENGVTTLSSIHAESQIAPALITEDWRFTKDNPQYDDNGRVYRQQYLAPLGKRRRSVEVDADDLEMIIER